MATVVVPTRNRPADLARCLQALARQSCASLEVIVVDDGSKPPVGRDLLKGVPGARLLAGEGSGPGAARNLGVRNASTPLILFTDDDTQPEPGWAAAALGHLSEHPEHLAVQGPVQSFPYDRLYSYSVEGSGPAHFWTCNMAYRREAFEAVGGFDPAFPSAHAEDRDLAFRVLRNGSIGYAEDMVVWHTPREATLSMFYRRGRLAQSDLILTELHPEHMAFETIVPLRMRGAISTLRSAAREARRESSEMVASPRRAVRAIAVAVASCAGALVGGVAWRPSRRDR